MIYQIQAAYFQDDHADALRNDQPNYIRNVYDVIWNNLSNYRYR